LGWYSLGLLNTLEIASRDPEQLESDAYGSLRKLFQDVMRAQVEAVERSKLATGVPGVWQVVDAPGKDGNFVEASGSFMTVYTLLRGIRLDLLDDTTGENAKQSCAGSRIVNLAKEIYGTVSDLYLISHANGSLSLGGTSSVSSLSPQGVGYDYYVTRPREVDSLIGTSAFALASWEVGRL
jgi:rhamnogalacturonyl hydrolase YesR